MRNHEQGLLGLLRRFVRRRQFGLVGRETRRPSRRRAGSRALRQTRLHGLGTGDGSRAVHATPPSSNKTDSGVAPNRARTRL